MKALCIIGIIVLALLLLSLVRIGGTAKYNRDGFRAFLRVGPLSFLLYPREKKKEKKKEPRKKHPADGQKMPGGTWAKLKEMLPFILEAAGTLKRKIRIDKIELELTVAAGGDAAKTAMAFGGANAFLGMIWPAIENNFEVKERSIRTTADFEAAGPTALAEAAFSLTIGQAVVFGIKYGLGGMLKYRKLQKTGTEERKADSYGKQPSHS